MAEGWREVRSLDVVTQHSRVLRNDRTKHST